MSRRPSPGRLAGLAAAVAAVVLATACGQSPSASRSPAAHQAHGEVTLPAPAPAGIRSTEVPPALPPIPRPHPGVTSVVWSVPTEVPGAVAITVDDGFCDECVGGYVRLAEQGLHVTFCPNGRYQSVWRPYVPRIRALLARGRVQLCNHTYSHPDLRTLSDAQIAAEITRNEDWIERTFGVTTRPYLRPPFGAHDRRVDAVAARLGFTRILLWNGSFGDSGLLDARTLLGEASKYLRPGTSVLCHANYPTAVRNFAAIQAMISDRGLHPMTLDELFATSRAQG